MKYYSPQDISALRKAAKKQGLIVYRSDTRNEGFFTCKDMKVWLERYGFDLQVMLNQGYAAIELLDKSNNDLVALMAVECALKRRARGVTDIVAKGCK